MTENVYRNITIRMMGDGQSRLSPEVIKESTFLQCAFSLNLGRIVAPGAEGLKTDALGHLWHDVHAVDGAYSFEIATVLPYFLPYFDDAPECVMEVRGTRLVVSSRMLQCYFSKTSRESGPLQYYLVHRTALDRLVELEKLTHVHPVPLRTFVAKRMRVVGDTAEQIIQAHFYTWVRDFVGDLSRFLDSIRAASPEVAKHVLPQSAGPFLPVFWVLVSGKDDKCGIEQFAGDMPSAAFRALSNLDKAAMERVRAFLADDDAIAVHESALALARSYVHYGYTDLAIVQICIACESALARCYESFLTARGVSKSKYSEAEREISLSQLLNLHLAAMRDLSKLKHRHETLGRLNWARRCRNNVVHKGTVQGGIASQEVERAIDAAHVLIEFLLMDSNVDQN